MFPDEKLNVDIWVWELAARTWTRVSTDPAIDGEPAWMPDGQSLIFTSLRTGVIALFEQAANGTGAAELLSTLNRQNSALPVVTPDGKQVVLRAAELGSSFLAILELDRRGAGAGGAAQGSQQKPLVKTAFEELNAEISPNGRWLAYQSNNSGAFEIYVRPFPNVADGLWTVSTEGGTEPLWSRDGRELFYRAGDGALMRVEVTPGTTWKASAPGRLFDASAYGRPAGLNAPSLARTYDVSRDGRRFLMAKAADLRPAASPPDRIVVVQNWLEELTRILPTR